MSTVLTIGAVVAASTTVINARLVSLSVMHTVCCTQVNVRYCIATTSIYVDVIIDTTNNSNI